MLLLDIRCTASVQIADCLFDAGIMARKEGWKGRGRGTVRRWGSARSNWGYTVSIIGLELPPNYPVATDVYEYDRTMHFFITN